MNTTLEKALALGAESTMRDRTIDITTIGAQTGQPRRIEIWFHSVDGVVYITGTPGARSWYANMLENPEFTFHLKHGIEADLPARAVPITNPDERAPLFARIIDGIRETYAREGLAPNLPPEQDWLAGSPLVRVTFL